MALPQFDSFKQLSFSHECCHSDDYFPERFIFFLPSVGCTVVTSILYFPLNHVEVWTGFVWLTIESLNIVSIGHYILQKKSSLFWCSFFISDSVSCNAVNLYTAAIISFYAT